VKIRTDNGKLSTREIILEAIKQANEATVEDLAQAADVSPVTVRHHLNSLQAEGLLKTRSVRRKVGRPYYKYSLSESGHEIFPTRYVRLSGLLLDELKARFPSELIDDLLANVVDRIVERDRGRFDGQPMEERLDYLVEILAREGFLASWESTQNGYRLTEYSCPYYSVGQKHHEVCGLDRKIIKIVLETDIKQHSCMLHGDADCQFSIG